MIFSGTMIPHHRAEVLMPAERYLRNFLLPWKHPQQGSRKAHGVK